LPSIWVAKGITLNLHFRLPFWDVLPIQRATELLKKSRFTLAALRANTIKLIPKKTLAIIILFATIGLGGVLAATSISINAGSPVSLGAGYAAATSCDESVTLNAKTAFDPSSGQLYVATIALSDVDQDPSTGCGYRNAEVALKINGQMTYASWTIGPSATSDTFSFTSATVSISYKYAQTVLTPFQADGLTNVAVKMSGNGYKVGDTGPGGGRVFYASTTGFNCGPSYTATGSPYNYKCYYLEVAPSGWNTGSDPSKPWAVTAYQSANVSTITDDASPYRNVLGVGLGYQNSNAIVTQNGVYNASTNNYAAGAARAYAGGSKTDWYLPTTAELNLLCQWVKGIAPSVTGGCSGGTTNSATYGASSAGFIDGGVYQSSSEAGAAGVYWQFFGDGGIGEYEKWQSVNVRPVRAF
jgi:hypothetical protein